jgi:diguanylate cyclase (GGDEF)-like protein
VAEDALIETLKNKLKLAVNLPSPPAIAQQIMAMAAEPEADVGRIAVAISKDPGLTAKVLRVANSSMYSRGRRSENLRQALMLLGLNAATTLALSFSLVGTYKAGDGSGIDYPRFWRRAILGASAARIFAKGARASNVDDIFLGALLQDIAVLAIDRVQSGFYTHLPVPATHAQLIHYERQALGVDHAHVTGWLLRHWKLPEPLCTMAEASHDPTTIEPDAPLGSAARCIALGSECTEVLLAQEGQAQWPKLAAQAQSWLGLGPEALADAMNTLIAEIPEIETLFDTSLLDSDTAAVLLDQAREMLTLRNLQALDQVNTLKESSDQLAARTTLLEDKHRRDPLTGLYNRGHLDEVLAKEFQSATAGGWPLSVVFVDLDRFKLVNDTYGHPAGDAVLVGTAKLLLDVVRDTDCVARYGGEEFVIVFPGLDSALAEKVCERLLTRLREAQHAITTAVIRSTASLGLATHSAGTPFASVAQLIEAADRSVYAAKKGGRDRLVRFDFVTLARSA